MNEELIKQIVRRILSDSAFQSLLKGNEAENVAVKQNGLVLLNFISDFERVLMLVKQRWGTDYSLNILPSDSVCTAKPDLPEGMNWITSQDALASGRWQKIIIPACSPNILAKVSLGIRDNPFSEIIGRGITQGIPIELNTDYLGFTSQTPRVYRELYNGYIQQVESYGVQVFATLRNETSKVLDKDKMAMEKQAGSLTEGSILAKSAQSNGSSFQELRFANNEKVADSREVILFAKKLLAEKDAIGFPSESMVIVEKSTVISPLARDTLKTRRIELRQEMEVRV